MKNGPLTGDKPPPTESRHPAVGSRVNGASAGYYPGLTLLAALC